MLWLGSVALLIVYPDGVVIAHCLTWSRLDYLQRRSSNTTDCDMKHNYSFCLQITFEVLGFFITFFDIFIAYADAYFAAFDFKPTGDEQFNVHEFKTWVLVGYYLLTALKSK